MPISRALILTPTALPTVSGNAITTQRWWSSLSDLGLEVRLVATSGLASSALCTSIEHFRPDLVHAHHAWRSGALLLEPDVDRALQSTPIVVSTGGTDIHLDADDADRREVVRRVLERARVIVTQSQETRDRTVDLFPWLAGRTELIPKAFAWHGDDPFPLRERSRCGPDDVLFLVPAGIRPVKGNRELLSALARIHGIRPCTKVAFVGPPVETNYAACFGREIARHGRFACWIAGAPPAAMRAIFAGSDIVVNGSVTEGLANALLESNAAGRPILASAVPGNRWPVAGDPGDRPSGLLYDPGDPDDLVRKAIRLVDDPALRAVLGQNGRDRAALWPTPEEEGRRLLSVYERASTLDPAPLEGEDPRRP
jgi:glycosyltransferase involved in cell wall biosynthesis